MCPPQVPTFPLLHGGKSRLGVAQKYSRITAIAGGGKEQGGCERVQRCSGARRGTLEQDNGRLRSRWGKRGSPQGTARPSPAGKEGLQRARNIWGDAAKGTPVPGHSSCSGT